MRAFFWGGCVALGVLVSCNAILGNEDGRLGADAGSGGVAASDAGGNGGTAASGAGGTGGGLSGAGGTSGGGTGGAGGSGGSDGGEPTLGRACTADADCGGLTCLTASSGTLDGGGPAKGLCTTSCASDLGCQGLGTNATCLEYTAGAGYCFENCTLGNPGPNFLKSKCQGRPEMACSPQSNDGVTLSGSVCVPQCNGDEDCGDLLHCDPKSGLCRTTAPAGKSLGEKCTDGGSSECTGNCAPSVNPGSSVPFTYTCTQNCTIGALPQCGWDGAGKAPGFCLITSLLNSSPGVGDQGLCVQLCSCNSDCGNPDLVCRALNSSGLETALGQHGYCHTPVNEDGGTDPGITACN